MPEVKRSVRIDAPVEVVFEVISDYESYPEFLPEVEEIRVERSSERSCRVHYKVRVIKKVEYCVEIEADPPTSKRWKMISGGGPMKANSGSWTLEPDGDGTMAHYQLEISFGRLVPGKIQTKLAEASLPAMLDQFKKRAELKAAGGAA